MLKKNIEITQDHGDFGKNNLFQVLSQKLIKSPVPDSAVYLHNRRLEEVESLGKTIKFADSKKFSSQEFLQLVQINHKIHKDEKFLDSFKLFEAAIKAQELFLKIDQTEIQYRSIKQQELYKFVEGLLVNPDDREAFCSQIKAKLDELLTSVKSEEGKKSLQFYTEHMISLSQYELGLRLLSLFKSYQLSNYTILRRIAELVERVLGQKQDLTDLKEITILVMERLDDFEKVGQIININGSLNVPETYAKMVQYVALNEKHQKSFSAFEKLLQAIQKWNKPYQIVVGVRREYPATEYKRPKDFAKSIPGEDIYLKYKQNLTDPKTGEIFADLGDEEAQADFFREFGVAIALKERQEQSQKSKLSSLKGSLILFGCIGVPIALGVGAIHWMEANKANEAKVEKTSTQEDPINSGNLGIGKEGLTEANSQLPASNPDEDELKALQKQSEKRQTQLKKTYQLIQSISKP